MYFPAQSPLKALQTDIDKVNKHTNHSIISLLFSLMNTKMHLRSIFYLCNLSNCGMNKGPVSCAVKSEQKMSTLFSSRSMMYSRPTVLALCQMVIGGAPVLNATNHGLNGARQHLGWLLISLAIRCQKH